MAGLFDFSGIQGNAGPLFQGLLAGAGAALASRGNRAQAIGSGLLGAVGGYEGGQQNALMADHRNQQRQAQLSAQQRQQRQMNYLSQFGSGDTASAPFPSAMPTAGSPVAFPLGDIPGPAPQTQSAGPTWMGLLQAGFDPESAQKILSQGGPQIKDIEAKDFTQESLSRYLQTRNPADLVAARERKIAANGQVYDPYSVQAGTVFNDPNAAFMINSQGQIVPNTPAQQYELRKASAGAARTNVNVDNKMGGSLAGQIGPMMTASQDQALAAGKQILAADSIDAALASGNVITGAGANVRLTVDQIASSLGIEGGDRKERLANTRQMLQGLAQLTLQGRQQMRGQGAITENESKLAERAISGDLSLTPAEIQVLTNSARRAGQYAQNEHSRKVQSLQSNPEFAPLVPFYTVPDIQSSAPAQAAGAASTQIDNLLNKYR